MHRKRLKRYERPDDLRFLTFSCYQRLPLFQNDRIKDRFVAALEVARGRWRFHLYGWVIMPEHVHLLLWPCLPEWPVSLVMSRLKGEFAAEIIGRWRRLEARILDRLTMMDGKVRFWQHGGGYDRNIFTMDEAIEKLEYIHKNPAARGLVARPEDWMWSSARWYLEGTGLTMDPWPPQKPVAE